MNNMIIQRSDLRRVYGFPHFQGMTPVEIGDLLDQGKMMTWAEGDQLFHYGAAADRFFLLVQGVVRAVRPQSNGTQIIPLHIPAGELFGVSMALGQDRYPVTAVAAADCVTIDWPSAHWPEIRTRHPGISVRLDHEIGNRIEALQNHIEALTTRTVEQRIAAALLRLGDEIGRHDPAGRRIGITLTRATLAEMAGTTLYTASRTMSQWEKLGLLRSTRGHVTLRDVPRLEDLRDGV